MIKFRGTTTRGPDKEFVGIFSTDKAPSVAADSIQNAFAHAATKPTMIGASNEGLIYWNAKQMEANLNRYTDSAAEISKGITAVARKERERANGINNPATTVRQHAINTM